MRRQFNKTVLLVLNLTCAIALCSEEAHLLDLTDHSSQTALGLPGYSSGGGGRLGLDGRNLPVPIVTLQTATINEAGDLTGEIVFSNVDVSPFRLPNSFDQAKVFAAGCMGRVEMVFVVVVLDKDDREQFRYPLDTTYGSNCDLRSITEIRPSRKLAVRLKQHNVAVRVKAGDRIEVTLQVFQLSNASYVIDSKSTVLVSNAKTVKG